MTDIQPLTQSDFIIFGGMGNLALNKIYPALYLRMQDGQLPQGSRIILCGRSTRVLSDLLPTIKKQCQSHIPNGQWNAQSWDNFAQHLHYAPCPPSQSNQWNELQKLLSNSNSQQHIFYCAVPPAALIPLAHDLQQSGLINHSSKLVLEKPLGENEQSFLALDAVFQQLVPEERLYRIDHYLGKETVQNLMILRFANPVLASVWDNHSIDNVNITVSETVSADGREGYYDQAGALRDMVQNHLLQLLCLVAMEPPSRITPDTVRDEKCKVLHALRPFTDLTQLTMGQYEGYGGNASTETAVSLTTYVDNWRWSGVPFHIRTGKCWKERYSEIEITFKATPHDLFPNLYQDPEPNALIIRLQPDERIGWRMNSKIPGPGGYRIEPVIMDLSLRDAHDAVFADAYERLLMDVVRGNPTLFMRHDEVASAWHWIDDLRALWQESGSPITTYARGCNASLA